MDWSFYDRGFSLFPLTPNSKRPAIEEWMPYQTCRAAPDVIANWAKWGNFNTGVATGAVSNCVVLDCDNLMARIEAEARGLPETLTVSTPRGTHFYFQHPGWDVSNRAGRSWTVELDGGGVDGWDLRGDGGYVVGPGSYFQPSPVEEAKGKVAGWYRIERDVPVAQAPDWLLALIFPKARKPNAPAKTADITSEYGRVALNGEVAKIMATSPGDGHCNDQINGSAFAIGQLVGGGEINEAEAWGALWEALETIGVVDDGKSPGTLERGFEAGKEAPRAADETGPVAPEIALGTRAPVAPPPPGPDGQMAPPAPPPPNKKPWRTLTPVSWVLPGEIPDYFAGCVYVSSRDQMFLPHGVLVGKSAFDGLYGGPNFALYEGKNTRSAWETFRQNGHVNMPMVWDVCFRPELPPGQTVVIEGLPFHNIYVPIQTPRQKGDASPFLNHVRKMLPSGQDADYVLHWMASCVQNPGKKFFWWPVIQGAKGNGKSLLIAVMTAALGERYSHNVKADSVIKTGNQFNDWIVGKLFLGFHEIRSSEGRRDFVEIMKDSVTEKRLSAEGKGKGQSTVDNRANGMMCTNWKDACPVDDDERRWGIFYSAQQCAEDLDRDGMSGNYFPALYDWLDNGGYAIVTDYLATMPLQAELDPARGLHRAPFTTSTQEAIVESRGVIEQEIEEAIDCESPGFRGGIITSFALKSLLERMRKTVGPKRFRSIMASVGYVTHPALEASRGRPNNPLFDATRPVLYYRKGHEILAMTVYSDVINATETILKGDQPTGSNVIPLRR